MEVAMRNLSRRNPHRAREHDAFIIETWAPGHAGKQKQIGCQENYCKVYQKIT